MKKLSIICILALLILSTVFAGIQQDAIKQKSMIICFMHGEGATMAGGDSKTAFSDVKWGDSTLIAFPNGQTMLIDGGMATYAPVLLKKLEALGVNKLDYVVVSHRHDDHHGGLTSRYGVLNNLEVGTVISSGILNGNSSSPKLIESLAKEKGFELVYMAQGDVLNVGDVKISALWPVQGLVFTTEDTTESVNDTSLVLKFEYKNNSALFPGDLYMGGEAELIYKFGTEVLDCDVLKIPHHGRPTSSSKDFVSAVSPKVAVALGNIIMEASTYATYTRFGCSPYMDAYDGYVTVTLSGNSIKAESSKTRDVPLFDKYDKAFKLVHGQIKED